MKNFKHTQTSRRQFLIETVPACALVCIGSSGLPGMRHLSAQQEGKHKFDQPLEFVLTHREIQRRAKQEKIQLIKTLIKELGEERTIEILKIDTREAALAQGQRQAQAVKRAGKKNDFNTYVSMFRDPKRGAYTLTKEIIEDSEKAFELKVTECLYAETYIKAGLGGEVGFAALCYMDYFWPKGFNENIKMVRDKTLIQGHDCCNHRYIWTG
jgi:hypothetical protein